MTPIISVIVPCYNQAKYLPETLQSVLDQEFQQWECLIVNDGSTDNSHDIANQWVKKDPRFRYYYKENSGVSDTRNVGIKQAQGEFILPLDGDDIIGTQYIKDALEVFSKNSRVKLVYSNLTLFGAKNEKLPSKPYVYENMFTENQIFASAIFRRSDFLKTDGYNVNMAEGLEDWDFWLTFLSKDDIVVKLDEFHFHYRIKEVSRSTMIDSLKNEKLLLQIFKNHVPLFLEYFNPIRNKIEAEAYKKEIKWHYNTTEYRIGRIICKPYNLLKKAYHKIFSKEN